MQVEVISLDTGSGSVGRRVGVNGNEKVGFRAVGNRSTLSQRNEGIVGSRENDVCALLLANEFAEAQGDIEH
jgi:hypothetical protein